MKRLRLAACVVCAMWFAAPAAFAQNGTISGTVRDAVTSAPLADIWVSLVDPVTKRFANVSSVQTDASGHYSLNAPAGTYLVNAGSSSNNTFKYIEHFHGYGPCSGQDCFGVGTPVVLAAGATQTVDFSLARGGTISGTVQVPTNPSITFLNTVRVYNANGRLATLAPVGMNGHYETQGLQTGTYFARATTGTAFTNTGIVPELFDNIPCPNFAAATPPRVPDFPDDADCRIVSGTPISITAPSTTTVNFTLEAGASISGTVVAEGSASPLVGVAMYAMKEDLVIASAITDGLGRYTLAGLLAGSYRVKAVAVNDYVDEWHGNVCVGCAGTPTPVTVGATSTVTGIDFSLAIGGSISGTITCQITTPPVWLLAPIIYAYNSAGDLVGASGGPGADPTKSCHQMNPTSTYVVRGLPPGQYYLLARDQPFFQAPFLSDPLPDGGFFVDRLHGGLECIASDCDVRRGPPVTVTAGAATPVDFTVATGASSEPLLDTLESIALFDARGVELTDVVRSSLGLGSVLNQIVGLPPGTYYAKRGSRLHGGIFCVDCPPTSGTPIVVRPGDTSIALNFGTVATRRINGTVRDEGAAPLSTITVEIFTDTGLFFGNAQTNVLGQYVLLDVPDGAYFLRTRNDRGYADEVYLDIACSTCDARRGTPVVVTGANVANIDFTLAPAGSIRGTTTDSAGVAVGGVPVSLLTSAGALAGQTVANPRGLFKLTLPAGSYRARAEATASHGAELFSELPCTSGACDLTAGTAIAVSTGVITPNISFTLASCSAMTLSPSLLATSVVGSAYRQVFTVSGGTGAKTFRLSSGTLPDGLTLDAVSGVLAGTPTSSGRYDVNVGAIDASGCATARTLTLDVQACAFTLSPAGATLPAAGGDVTISIGGPCGPQTVTNATGFVHEQSNTPGQVVLRVDANTGSSPRTWDVTIGRRVFNVRQAGTGSTAPIGAFDAPLDGSQASGSLPLGGWALDDLEVTRVQILRDPVGGESGGQIFLGNAVFVRGARPDVAGAYATYPLHDRAGWGFLILTNMLPNQGNGAFRIYAYAEDAEGGRTLLGAKTIIATNATATDPFGAIDTPTQGATIAGPAHINFGWALTPQPKIIPTDGSTIHVMIDGVSLGHPTYNVFRPDVSGLFPGLANSGGPVGYKILDTTALAEGQHTIAWIVYDSLGAGAGIGSRYFSVANSADAQPADQGGVESGRRTESLARLPVSESPVLIQRGDGEWRRVRVADTGSRTVVLGALERLELQLDAATEECVATWAGYSVEEQKLRDLPVGATIDPAGTFYWQPGPGFSGGFDLLFVRTACDGSKTRLSVRVVIGR